MNELPSEPREAPIRPLQKRVNWVLIALIIAATIVALACIAAATVVLWTFFRNPPWML